MLSFLTLQPPAGEGNDPIVSCITQESGPCPSSRQHSKADPVDKDTSKSTLRLSAWETKPHTSSPSPTSMPLVGGRAGFEVIRVGSCSWPPAAAALRRVDVDMTIELTLLMEVCMGKFWGCEHGTAVPIAHLSHGSMDWVDRWAPPSMPGVGGRIGPELLRAGETFLSLISCRTWKVTPLPSLGNTVELGLKVLLWEIWPQDIKAKLAPPFAHPCSEWTYQANDGELTLVVKRWESRPADQPWN